MPFSLVRLRQALLAGAEALERVEGLERFINNARDDASLHGRGCRCSLHGLLVAHDLSQRKDGQS